jgi:hypothetical protein
MTESVGNETIEKYLCFFFLVIRTELDTTLKTFLVMLVMFTLV